MTNVYELLTLRCTGGRMFMVTMASRMFSSREPGPIQGSAPVYYDGYDYSKPWHVLTSIPEKPLIQPAPLGL